MSKLAIFLLILVLLFGAIPLGSAELYRFDYNDELYF